MDDTESINDDISSEKDKKIEPTALENLHPAGWFYAGQGQVQGQGQKEGADDSRNIWKENWGGLIFEESNGKMVVQAASLNQLLIRLTSTSPDALAGWCEKEKKKRNEKKKKRKRRVRERTFQLTS